MPRSPKLQAVQEFVDALPQSEKPTEARTFVRLLSALGLDASGIRKGDLKCLWSIVQADGECTYKSAGNYLVHAPSCQVIEALFRSGRGDLCANLIKKCPPRRQQAFLRALLESVELGNLMSERGYAQTAHTLSTAINKVLGELAREDIIAATEIDAGFRSWTCFFHRPGAVPLSADFVPLGSAETHEAPAPLGGAQFGQRQGKFRRVLTLASLSVKHVMNAPKPNASKKQVEKAALKYPEGSAARKFILANGNTRPHASLRRFRNLVNECGLSDPTPEVLLGLWELEGAGQEDRFAPNWDVVQFLIDGGLYRQAGELVQCCAASKVVDCARQLLALDDLKALIAFKVPAEYRQAFENIVRSAMQQLREEGKETRLSEVQRKFESWQEQLLKNSDMTASDTSVSLEE